jgi:hypothetical protein
LIEIPSLEDVRIAWNKFNNLPTPTNGEPSGGHLVSAVSLPEEYVMREDAWKKYCKVRDHYLYSLKVVGLTELNSKWYPRELGYKTSKRVQ